MKSKHTARENDEFLKIRSLQKRDRLNIFVFFIIIILLLQFLGGCFLFLFFISTNWLIYVAYGNVSFGTC